MATYGGSVDDAISRDMWPTGEPAGILGVSGPYSGAEPLRGTREALEVIERHLHPLTTRQLAALVFLKQEGGPLGEIADLYLEHSTRRGAVSGLLDALAALSLVRSFRGVSVMRGTQAGVRPR
jgi:hypothetical protein